MNEEEISALFASMNHPPETRDAVDAALAGSLPILNWLEKRGVEIEKDSVNPHLFPYHVVDWLEERGLLEGNTCRYA